MHKSFPRFPQNFELRHLPPFFTFHSSLSSIPFWTIFPLFLSFSPSLLLRELDTAPLDRETTQPFFFSSAVPPLVAHSVRSSARPLAGLSLSPRWLEPLSSLLLRRDFQQLSPSSEISLRGEKSRSGRACNETLRAKTVLTMKGLNSSSSSPPSFLLLRSILDPSSTTLHVSKDEWRG